jgi:hypothetical protein
LHGEVDGVDGDILVRGYIALEIELELQAELLVEVGDHALACHFGDLFEEFVELLLVPDCGDVLALEGRLYSTRARRKAMAPPGRRRIDHHLLGYASLEAFRPDGSQIGVWR